MNVEQTIRRELELAWRNGKNAGTSGSLATMESIVDVGTERILKAVRDDPGNDMTLAYKPGKQSWHLDWMDGERSGDDDGGER